MNEIFKWWFYNFILRNRNGWHMHTQKNCLKFFGFGKWEQHFSKRILIFFLLSINNKWESLKTTVCQIQRSCDITNDMYLIHHQFYSLMSLCSILLLNNSNKHKFKLIFGIIQTKANFFRWFFLSIFLWIHKFRGIIDEKCRQLLSLNRKKYLPFALRLQYSKDQLNIRDDNSCA